MGKLSVYYTLSLTIKYNVKHLCQAGRWQSNKLTAELDVWQCSRAAEGAMDAASAAKR